MWEDQAEPTDSDEVSRELLSRFSNELKESADALASFATSYEAAADGFGDPKRASASAAAIRDQADTLLAQAFRHLQILLRARAESSRCVDLMVEAILDAMGNGPDCLKLIEAYYRRTGDETEGEGRIMPATMPDSFLRDVIQRVEALPALVDRYPERLRYSASRAQGLPMIVSHHIDVAPEFERLSEVLNTGSEHPFDVSPRRKRGGMTPAMRYLEPLVSRMNWLHGYLTDNNPPIPEKDLSAFVANAWTNRIGGWLPECQIETLRKLADVSRLTKRTAPDWSREVVVPYILLTDGADPATATEPFLRNIWAHRSVKSISTFRSRLERAVTDFLTRYGREE